MRYNELGVSGIQVSAVALGTWAMGGDFWGAIDDRMCIEALNAGLDAGINIIDTAPIYGKGYSETLVGKAIKGRRRDEIILATKCGIPFDIENGRDASRATILREIDESLGRLQTDYVDLYQVHWPDPNTPIQETMETLAELKKQGKIRAIGVSNFDCAMMDECRKYVRLDSLQPPYSLLDRDAEKELIPYCREHGIGVLSYGSLGAGMLTGKFTRPLKVEGGDKRARFYPYLTEPRFSKARKLVDVLEEIAKGRGKPTSHVAINWVSQQPGMTTALVGCKTPGQAVENAAAGDWDLTADEIAAINKAYDAIYA